MNTKRGSFSGILTAIFLFAAGCSGGEAKFAEDISDLAGEINTAFAGIRGASEGMKGEIEAVYLKKDSLDLDIQGMDVKDGGVFETFSDNLFYYNTSKDGAAYYFSPMAPVTADMKKDVRLFQYIEPLTAKAGASSQSIATVFYGIHQPYSLCLFYPWGDVVSLMPPGLHVEVFPFYQRGWESEGSSVWSPVPFTDLARGWVMEVSTSVSPAGKKTGVASISISMEKLSSLYLKNRSEVLILTDSNLTAVGVSTAGKKLLGLNVLEDYDYIKHMKENTFVPEIFRLGNETQPLAVKEIAMKVTSGDLSTDIVVGEGRYKIMVNTVPEVNFKLLALYPR